MALNEGGEGMLIVAGAKRQEQLRIALHPHLLRNHQLSDVPQQCGELSVGHGEDLRTTIPASIVAATGKTFIISLGIGAGTKARSPIR
jgi:hypothetical protein